MAVRRFRALVSDRELNLDCIDDDTGYSPLLLLCLYQQCDKVCEHIDFLLQSNRVDVNLQAGDEYTALRLLCKYHTGKNLVSILSLLILHGANDMDLCVDLLRDYNLYPESERVSKIVELFTSGLSRVSHYLNRSFF